MKDVLFEVVCSYDIERGAILHTHEPFIKDYLCLHSLLKAQNPKSVMEIGTHIGEGTQIICNALPDAKVYSLDLPEGQAHKTLQHPSLKHMGVGQMCGLPYKQLWGDSLTFLYGQYEAWFIDGEHDYAHPKHETLEAIKSDAKLIIWHDADMTDVHNAITDSFAYNKDYELYLVTGTRIAYAIRL